MKSKNTLIHYTDKNGNDLITEWLKKLRDLEARDAIARRLRRIEGGNFGDHKPVRDGVWDLRIDTGPGYRVYYAKSGETVILLLCGGDKRKQDADIERACKYWREWQKESTEETDNER